MTEQETKKLIVTYDELYQVVDTEDEADELFGLVGDIGNSPYGSVFIMPYNKKNIKGRYAADLKEVHRKKIERAKIKFAPQKQTRIDDYRNRKNPLNNWDTMLDAFN